MCTLIGTENSRLRKAEVTPYTCNNLSTFGFYVHCILYPYCQLYLLVLLRHCVLHTCFQFYLLHSSCNVAEPVVLEMSFYIGIASEVNN